MVKSELVSVQIIASKLPFTPPVKEKSERSANSVFNNIFQVKKVKAPNSECGMPWDISLLSNLSALILLHKGH